MLETKITVASIQDLAKLGQLFLCGKRFFGRDASIWYGMRNHSAILVESQKLHIGLTLRPR